MKPYTDWDSEKCIYCGARFHHSESEEHMEAMHSDLNEAIKITDGWTPRFRKVFLISVLAWFLMCGAWLLPMLFLKVEENWVGYIGITLMFTIFPILILIWVRRPREEKEAMEKAWEILRSYPMVCPVCRKPVPSVEYLRHQRTLHRKQWRVEMMRIVTFVLFIGVFLGGMMLIFLMVDSGILQMETFRILLIAWVVSVSAIMLLVFYLGQRWEPRHDDSMQREWEDEKFQPKSDWEKH